MFNPLGWARMRPLGTMGQSFAAWVMRAEGMKMWTQSILSSHVVVLGTVLVLLLSNVSGSMGVDADVVCRGSSYKGIENPTRGVCALGFDRLNGVM